MFYQTGVDITNDKQMFNFLKGHAEYYVMNPWNLQKTIANHVKLYNLGLSGDWGVAYNLLAGGEYDTISFMIGDWQRTNPGYEIYFNGRSGGHLVLANKDNRRHVLPDEIVESEDYEEFKRWCKEYYGSVKAYRTELVTLVRLVQSFDRFCDELREFCDDLSRQTFEIIEMQKAVDQFNEDYYADLEYLGFSELRCETDGSVSIVELFKLQSLAEAFLRLADRKEYGYGFEYFDDNLKIRMVKK